MNEAEKQKILIELKNFHKRLKSYERYLDPNKQLSETQKRYRDSLREKLQRKIGELKDAITQLTGKQFYKQFGTINEIWAEGLRTSGYISSMRFALSMCIDVTNEAIGKLESTNITELQLKKVALVEYPKVFIAHGGDSPSLRKLERFIEALGVQSLIVEDQPSEGRSIAENVDYYARQSDFAIILSTKGDIDGKTGGFIPRGNILMEIGKLQEILKGRIVYLVQAGTKFPTNVSEKVWERFTPNHMDNAFIKIAKELRKSGILKTVKPQKEEQD